MDITFHYPPELMQLLVDVMPRLCRSKRDVLLFLRGAGVEQVLLRDLDDQLAADRTSLNKFAIVRTVLTRLNERGERALRERREILKRVVEYEDFSTCWPGDQLQAKGLVAEIRRVVNVKDSFTRINIEREREADARKADTLAKQRAAQALEGRLVAAHREFSKAIAEPDPRMRGGLLEVAANNVFKAYGISVREAFKVTDERGGRVLEQIDGVIDLRGHLYLVEMKWLRGSVSIDDVSRHLVRVYHRGHTRGLFVSATEFSQPALATCREALQRTVVTLALVEELVLALERRADLVWLLNEKVRAAQLDKNPFLRVQPQDVPPLAAPN